MPHQRPAACIVHTVRTVRTWYNHSQHSCAILPAGTAPVAMGSSARPQHGEGQRTTACFHCCMQKLARNSVLATGEPCSPHKHTDTSAKISASSQRDPNAESGQTGQEHCAGLRREAGPRGGVLFPKEPPPSEGSALLPRAPAHPLRRRGTRPPAAGPS